MDGNPIEVSKYSYKYVKKFTARFSSSNNIATQYVGEVTARNMRADVIARCDWIGTDNREPLQWL